MNNIVAISKIKVYDHEKIKAIIKEHFSLLGIDKSFFENKKVAIKPNQIMKKGPEKAATTHPTMISALVDILNEYGVHPIICESPGGVYTPDSIASSYRACGIANAVNGFDCTLNTDCSASKVEYSKGVMCKSFDVITPIINADIIFDMCKLKTHSLTSMSGAIKNFFGIVPGITKFEMHAAYPNLEDFDNMICDICQMLCETKEIVAITDAIVGMEGNGPTGGTPKEIGCILSSRNPFASDLAAEKILNFENEVDMINKARERNLCEKSYKNNIYPLEKPDDLVVYDVVKADSRKSGIVKMLKIFSTGRLGDIFSPKPVINNDKCRGCEECKNSCPKHTIEMIKVNGKKVAKINKDNCIKCFCCQELCPFVAIDTKRNFIIKIIDKMKDKKK